MNLQKQFENIDYLKDIVKDLRDRGLKLPYNFPLSLVMRDVNSYRFSEPRKTQIPKSDGKSMRDIYIYNNEDSFLLKIINKMLYDNCSEFISETVYSYKRGVRTFNAARVVQNGLIRGNLFGVKLDISNYFLSVSEGSLGKLISDLSSDQETFKFFFNLFNIGTDKYLGILPGSAISAFFANALLKDLDEWVKDNSLVYARYADDMVVFTNTQTELEEVLLGISKRLWSYGLSINPKKIKRFDLYKPVDFLGLEITKDYIDISDKTFSNLKHFVKYTCDKFRRMIHYDKKFSVDEGTRKCINYLQNRLYKSIFTNGNEHAGCRMSYVLGSVTTDKTLKLLDYYICDCLNDMRLDCHNKSPKRLSLGGFKEFGLVSVIKVWNMYKMNSKVCRVYIQSIIKPKISYISREPFEVMEFNSSGKFSINRLEDLLNFLDKFSVILIDGVAYPLEHLIVDFKSMEIAVVKDFKNLDDRIVLIRNGGVVTAKLYLMKKDDVREINLSKLVLDNVSEDDLLDSFHNSLMNYDLEELPKFSRWNCFGGLLSVFRLECDYGIKISDSETSLEIRTLKFYFNLYKYLLNNPKVFDKSYHMIDHARIPFVLIKDLL